MKRKRIGFCSKVLFCILVFIGVRGLQLNASSGNLSVVADAENPARAVLQGTPVYVTLDVSDASYGESSFLYAAHWSDNAIPHEGAHYVVESGVNIYGINSGSHTFKGDSLSLAGHFYFNYGNMTISNLRLLDGGVYENNSSGTLYGTATVESIDAPFDFRLVRSGTSKFPFVSMTFIGDSRAKMCFRRYNNNSQAGFNLYNSDFSRYEGTVINGTGIDGKGGGTNTYGNAVIPGTCVVSTNSSIKLYNYADSSAVALIGTLLMETNSTVYLPAKKSGNASITVTNKFMTTKGSKIVIEGCEAAVKGGNFQMALIRLTGNAALAGNLPDLDTLELVCLKDSGGALQGEWLSIEDDETTGGKTIYATFNNLKIEVPSDISAFSMNADTAPDYWSCGHVPKEGEGVLISARGSTIKDDDNFEFKGASLTIASGGILNLQSSLFSAKGRKIYAMEGSTVESMQYDKNKVSSGTHKDIAGAQGFEADELWICGTVENPSVFAVAQGRNLVVTAPLYGSGMVMASTRMDTSEPRGVVAFIADNSAFAGRFAVTSRNIKGKLDTSIGRRLRFMMDDAKNVGGAMASFTYDGFVVSEDAIVIGRQALTFAEQTRGVFIGNRARFVMQNEKRLTVNVPVTWRGEMVFGNDYPNAEYAKTGAGTGDLELGSRAMFLNDNGTVSDRPDAGTTSNRLLMVVGRVKPTTTNALDGVAVVFGEGSGGILLDINPAGDGMEKFGLYNKKWDVPFVNHRADGKIPVSFEGMEESRYEGRPFVRGICTVSEEAAKSLSDDDFAVAKPYSNVKICVTSVANGDGTVTFQATFTPKGLLISVR